MPAIDLVRTSLGLSDGLFHGLVPALRDHPTKTQSPDGGNHALWTIGHLAFVEAGLPGILGDGGPHPLAAWAPLFATGSRPTPDASAYPSFDELVARFREQRATTLKLLDAAGEAGLSKVPPHVPPGFEPMMGTVGQAFLLMSLHQMLHSGELADIRRTLGVKPLA